VHATNRCSGSSGNRVQRQRIGALAAAPGTSSSGALPSCPHQDRGRGCEAPRRIVVLITKIMKGLERWKAYLGGLGMGRTVQNLSRLSLTKICRLHFIRRASRRDSRRAVRQIHSHLDGLPRLCSRSTVMPPSTSAITAEKTFTGRLREGDAGTQRGTSGRSKKGPMRMGYPALVNNVREQSTVLPLSHWRSPSAPWPATQ
jgi:hypothetical protein